VSGTVSDTSGRRYPTKMVCDVFGVPRSSLYAVLERAGEGTPAAAVARCRPGPKPKIPDATLREKIGKVIKESPFQGEGHRRIHARLRLQDVHVSR